MTIELSAHARTRLQQRGIDEPVIEYLLTPRRAALLEGFDN